MCAETTKGAGLTTAGCVIGLSISLEQKVTLSPLFTTSRGNSLHQKARYQDFVVPRIDPAAAELPCAVAAGAGAAGACREARWRLDVKNR